MSDRTAIIEGIRTNLNFTADKLEHNALLKAVQSKNDPGKSAIFDAGILTNATEFFKEIGIKPTRKRICMYASYFGYTFQRGKQEGINELRSIYTHKLDVFAGADTIEE